MENHSRPDDAFRSSNEVTLIELQDQSDVDASSKSPFPNRFAMFKAAFWHDLDTLRWIAHVIAPIPVLLYLNTMLGVWFGTSATYLILALSVVWPPLRFSIFDSVPQAKTFFSVFFGAILLLSNTVAALSASALFAQELGAQGRSILVAGFAGGVACFILSVGIRTPFRELFHIPQEVKEAIRKALKDDEPSDAPKGRASRIDNGKSSTGPR